MLKSPFVSIIVPNWNGEHLLEECLGSLYNLKYPNYEVIVVDNGSTDNSIDLIKQKFQKTVIVAESVNLGFAGACNAGIKIAKGSVIALFNNDAFAEPYWLSKLVTTLLEDKKIAIAGGPIFYAQATRSLWSAGMQIDVITGIEWRVGHNKRINQVSDFDDSDYLSGCAIVFKKSLINEIGLLDETFFLYSEEVDWIFRAIRRGYKFKFNVSAIVWHKASSTRRKNPSRGYYYFIRARFRIYFIHYPLKYLVTSVFFQLTLFPIFEAFFFKTSSLYILERLKGFVWNIVNLKNTMNKRIEVNSMGTLRLKNRFRKFIEVLSDDRSSKSYDF